MTSRERVRNAIERKPVDRMPIDFGVHFSTGISVFAYQRLREYLGLNTDKIELIDTSQCLARVDDDILDRFHVDTVLLSPPFEKTKIWNPREDYKFVVPHNFDAVLQPDGAYTVELGGKKMRMPAGGFFFDGDWLNFAGHNEAQMLDAFSLRAEKLHKETERFTMLMGFSAFFDGIEQACDMLVDPEGVMARNEKRLADQIAYFDRVNAKMGKFIDSIEVNGDLGTQLNLMCTPDSYEQTVYPYLKRFCEYVHQNSDIKIFMHACGAINLALPFIVDAGVDAINPVQISANDMDPKTLKETYGKDICFWGGGCDTQNVLWKESPEFVKEHVENLIKIFAKDSGFVFNQVHNIMGNVPPENVVALYDTAYENSKKYL